MTFAKCRSTFSSFGGSTNAADHPPWCVVCSVHLDNRVVGHRSHDHAVGLLFRSPPCTHPPLSPTTCISCAAVTVACDVHRHPLGIRTTVAKKTKTNKALTFMRNSLLLLLVVVLLLVLSLLVLVLLLFLTWARGSQCVWPQSAGSVSDSQIARVWQVIWESRLRATLPLPRLSTTHSCGSSRAEQTLLQQNPDRERRTA